MYLDMFLHVGHTVKILKETVRNHCFSRVRTCDASFDVAIFACVFDWKRQYNQRVAHFFNMSVSKWSRELFWTSFGSLLETIWEVFWLLLGFLERPLVARAPSSFSFWPLARGPKGLRTLCWSVWNPVSSLWNLYKSVWNLCRAIWTSPGAILGPPSINS